MTIGTKNNYKQTGVKEQINSANSVFQGFQGIQGMKSGNALERVQGLAQILALIGG